MRPLLITFEGLDGSGKSTHLKLAHDWLRRSGVASVVTHEPGGTPFGEELRRVFLDPSLGSMDSIVELLLVFASRRRHLTEIVDPALEAGFHVLCDRFTDSSFAYQGAGRGLAAELIDQVDEIATGRRRPDRTILFDLPSRVARERGCLRRENEEGGQDDRLDREDLSFYERVREGFLERADREPERFTVVSSESSLESTLEAVQRALADLLPE